MKKDKQDLQEQINDLKTEINGLHNRINNINSGGATQGKTITVEYDPELRGVFDNDRYNMCKDQPAQIDCRLTECVWHKDGKCTNVSPAISINQINNSTCWSHEEVSKENKMLVIDLYNMYLTQDNIKIQDIIKILKKHL